MTRWGVCDAKPGMVWSEREGSDLIAGAGSVTTHTNSESAASFMATPMRVQERSAPRLTTGAPSRYSVAAPGDRDRTGQWANSKSTGPPQPGPVRPSRADPCVPDSQAQCEQPSAAEHGDPQGHAPLPRRPHGRVPGRIPHHPPVAPPKTRRLLTGPRQSSPIGRGPGTRLGSVPAMAASYSSRRSFNASMFRNGTALPPENCGSLPSHFSAIRSWIRSGLSFSASASRRMAAARAFDSTSIW